MEASICKVSFDLNLHLELVYILPKHLFAQEQRAYTFLKISSAV